MGQITDARFCKHVFANIQNPKAVIVSLQSLAESSSFFGELINRPCNYIMDNWIMDFTNGK